MVVILCVCYQANRYIPHLQVQNVVLYGFFQCSKCKYYVYVTENALFSSFDVIC